MLVQVIKEVPDKIFDNCLTELSKIDWERVQDGRKQGVFKTSTSIHLRSHDVSKSKKMPTTIDEFSSIVDCADNKGVIERFPEHYKAAEWIMSTVQGIKLGRIMIVHLEPNGKINMHIDPGAYFEKHSRYHIPLITNPLVQFFDSSNNREHMPVKTLCRLNNLSNHGLVNESNEARIHLIVDVETPGGNSTF